MEFGVHPVYSLPFLLIVHLLTLTWGHIVANTEICKDLEIFNAFSLPVLFIGIHLKEIFMDRCKILRCKDSYANNT